MRRPSCFSAAASGTSSTSTSTRCLSCFAIRPTSSVLRSTMSSTTNGKYAQRLEHLSQGVADFRALEFRLDRLGQVGVGVGAKAEEDSGSGQGDVELSSFRGSARRRSPADVSLSSISMGLVERLADLLRRRLVLRLVVGRRRQVSAQTRERAATTARRRIARDMRGTPVWVTRLAAVRRICAVLRTAAKRGLSRAGRPSSAPRPSEPSPPATTWHSPWSSRRTRRLPGQYRGPPCRPGVSAPYRCRRRGRSP